MPERNSSLGTWIKRFLMEYLPTERNLAINTLKSYRDGLTLLLPFVAERCSKGFSINYISFFPLCCLNNAREEAACCYCLSAWNQTVT